MALRLLRLLGVSGDYNQWRVVSLSPWSRAMQLSALCCAIVVVGLAVWALRHEPKRSRRAILLVLRLGAVLGALALFFEPALQLENVTRVPNHIAVLVDVSESMLLGEGKDRITRQARAMETLRAARPSVERYATDHRLDFYTFGDRLSPSTEAQAAAVPQKPEPATRLREALAQLRGRYEGRDLAGAIVISDGIDNGRLGAAAAGDPETNDFIRSLEAPIHTVWVGRRGLMDIAVTRVMADDFAFVRTALKIDAVLTIAGADEAGWTGKSVPVMLRREGIVERTQEVRIEPGRVEYPVHFQITPDRVGKYLYEIATPEQPGEAIVENNSRAFVLKVIRDKIRVLLVAGRPSWDERFLRGLLKHDPNVDLISFFILRTPSDVENVSPDELSLIPFPTEELFQEQLRSFDLIFLQNFNFSPYGIGAYLGEIRRYVDEGGALAMLGGDLSFTQGGYAGTPIADVLPVELIEGGGGLMSFGVPPPEVSARLTEPQPFRMKLTGEGRLHPITALKLDPAQNSTLWGKMPELSGANLINRAKSNATVLGVHPQRTDAAGQPLPTLAVTDTGKGRTLALMSDSSWRWSFGEEEATASGHTYQRFWGNAIRWLIHDPALSLLRVETDEAEYPRGQKIQLSARLVGPDYQPVRGSMVSVTVTKIAGRGDVVFQRANRTDEAGELRAELELPPGGYRATARATLSGRSLSEDEIFLVRGSGSELEQIEARDDLLRALSKASGGTFHQAGDKLADLEFVPPRVVRVNQHRDVELWSGAWMLILCAGCLAANWALRRKWGYA